MSIDVDLYRSALAHRLGQLRTPFGLSQLDFQDTLGLGQNTIFRAEGNVRISLEALLKLALYYVQKHQINADWLFNPDHSAVPQLTEQAVLNRRKVAIVDGMIHEVRVAELL